MTESQFLALPDREKDALVAEKVMGCNVKQGFNPITAEPDITYKFCGCESRDHHCDGGGVLEYTTSIAAAWEVVERWPDGYFIEKDGDGYAIWEMEAYRNDLKCKAKSAPLAICLAALKAKGVVE